MKSNLFLIAMILLVATSATLAEPVPSTDYKARASEVTQYIQTNLFNSKTGLYFRSTADHKPEFMWGNGIMFSALVGAARSNPDVYLPVMSRFFNSMDRYWDTKAAIPGYEPQPTNGGGNDKYYDDNEWMVITFAEAYELTHEQRYLQRASATLKFSLSGWDDQLDGGIWWHEGHKGGGKNTCANGPAAVGCLRGVARFLPPADAKSAIAMAVKIVDWTDKNLEADDGLYIDSETVATQKKNGGKLTYNTALMIRADLGLYRATGKDKYLQSAKRSAKASDWFLSNKTGAYRDSIKWSHLLVEADLEMYRATHEEYLLTRAKANADHFYASWKSNPPAELIDNASIARLLWLMADTQSTVGKQFWAHADQVGK